MIPKFTGRGATARSRKLALYDRVAVALKVGCPGVLEIWGPIDGNGNALEVPGSRPAVAPACQKRRVGGWVSGLAGEDGGHMRMLILRGQMSRS